ncbi:MAG: TIM barrel protein [Candidatus Woesearchaeota archaeon]
MLEYKLRFGPSGNDKLFYIEGNKKSVEAPNWISKKGLSLYEYSFGRGIRLKEETARKIGEEARNFNIFLTVHAPYYVNFANPEKEKIEKSINYIVKTAYYAKLMGAKKIVVHPGSQLKMDRKTAFANTLNNFKLLVSRLKQEKLDSIYICPETMGKTMQIGTLDEIIELSKIDKMLIPTIDFGHINAFNQGILKNEEDFDKIFKKLKTNLSLEKFNNLHIHFSKIMYTQKGEKQHLTLDDNHYGPDEVVFLRSLIKNMEDKSNITVVCESQNIMAQDALKLKKKYLDIIKGE